MTANLSITVFYLESKGVIEYDSNTAEAGGMEFTDSILFAHRFSRLTPREIGQRRVQSKGVGIVVQKEVGFVLATKGRQRGKAKAFLRYLIEQKNMSGRCDDGSLLHNII